MHRRFSHSEMDRIRKRLFKLFNDLGLKITVDTNLSKIDFLDITMDLSNETHQPYRKPNDTPLYINTKSNHPPHVLKNLNSAINKRLNMLSSNSQIFDNAKAPYEAALKQSGHPSELKFDNAPEPTTNQNNNKKRKKQKQKYYLLLPPIQSGTQNRPREAISFPN